MVSPGVNRMTVTHLKSHMKKYYKPLQEKLKDGSYQPQPVKEWLFLNLMELKDIWEYHMSE